MEVTWDSLPPCNINLIAQIGKTSPKQWQWLAWYHLVSQQGRAKPRALASESEPCALPTASLNRVDDWIPTVQKMDTRETIAPSTLWKREELCLPSSHKENLTVSSFSYCGAKLQSLWKHLDLASYKVKIFVFYIYWKRWKNFNSCTTTANKKDRQIERKNKPGFFFFFSK